jgi:hypothetical protein
VHYCTVCDSTDYNRVYDSSSVCSDHVIQGISPIGGGVIKSSKFFRWDSISLFLVRPKSVTLGGLSVLRFVSHMPLVDALSEFESQPDIILCAVPLGTLASYLPGVASKPCMIAHGIQTNTHCSLTSLRDMATNHISCAACSKYVSVFHIQKRSTISINSRLDDAACSIREQHAASFPPAPCSETQILDAVTSFCNNSSAEALNESPCSVCATLTVDSLLSKDLKKFDIDWNLLKSPGVAPKERRALDDPLLFEKGPILHGNGNTAVCPTCLRSLIAGDIPVLSLANGNWIGEVPPKLRDLRLVERIMIARYRHNVCVVKVQGGQSKMRANAVVFAHPTPIYYNVLPRPASEMDEVLAILFVGPCAPTAEDMKRTPLLVRADKVLAALEWLIINNPYYHSLRISHENLKTYNGDMPPVPIVYTQGDGSVPIEAQSVYDKDEDPGTEEGPCPFAVHGLTGAQLSEMPYRLIIAEAVKHLKSGKSILAISHAKTPESIWNNPSLYPCLFPWLWPYGSGEFDNPKSVSKVPHRARKHQLLLYADDRFRIDEYFPVIAFNHEQIKDSAWSGRLLSRQAYFPSIVKRVLDIDPTVLENLVERSADGPIHPENDAEKAWFDLLENLHIIAGTVEGSNAGRKFMRSQLWSVIYNFSCPNWFITFAPNDVRHPICLYFAGLAVDLDGYSLCTPKYQERIVAICKNPVAGARFFHLMVTLFLKHILGIGSEHGGIFGNITHHYGTVEAQGRLTLHLHLLIWVLGGMTPQDVRNKIIAKDTEFERKLVEYLERSHKGEFLTGSMSSVREKVASKSGKTVDEYESESDNEEKCELDPTMTLPIPPRQPPISDEAKHTWREQMKSTVDELVFRMNRHTHRTNCLKNGCAARFPRDVHELTSVDRETGAIMMKKGESWINTYNEVMTYVLRCNSDVTSLMSGTAVRAVVAYVTDYVSKSTLSTHAMWAAIRVVFDKSAVLLNDRELSDEEKVRTLLTRVVNAFSAKQELGMPMICMYLLGNPDHYTSEHFVNFNWSHYLVSVQTEWNDNDSDAMELDPIDPAMSESVTVTRILGEVVALSKSQDYKFRADALDRMCLYDFVRMCYKVKGKNVSVRSSSPTDMVGGGLARSDKSVSDTYGDLSEDNMSTSIAGGHKRKRSLSPSSISTSNSQYDDSESDDTSYITETDSNSGYDEIPSHSHARSGDVDNNTGESCYSSTSTSDSDPKVGKIRKKSSKVENRLTFLEGHPQQHSHHLSLINCGAEKTPNFTGGMLPRRDQGNRERYCMTMLMFFKPWRTGMSLKEKNETWDEDFVRYTFTPRALELMDYFDSLYQCRDARDDLSRKRKGGQPLDLSELGIATEDLQGIDKENAQAMLLDGLTPQDHLMELLAQKVDHGQHNRDKLRAERADLLRNLLLKIGNKSLRPDFTPERQQALVGQSETGMSRVVVSRVFVSGGSRRGSLWKAALVNARRLLVDLRDSRAPKELPLRGSKSSRFKPNDVRLVNDNYLSMHFKSKLVAESVMANTISLYFTLNKDQERAFRIVVNHSVSLGQPQLNMYLGGMAGTGKSQVINAIVFWFVERQEEHRVMLMAPTGSAAALIGGSTYHSVLGFTSNGEIGGDTSMKTLAKVSDRLRFVDYTFIDECSMIPCIGLYRISLQMGRALNNTLDPCGGMNVVMAGDYGQLQPPGGSSLYSRAVSGCSNSRRPYKEQIESMGKAVWHGFTTVVLLTENLRQKGLSLEDKAFRVALENMRFAHCTDSDIALLRTCVATSNTERSRDDPNFRNVSIITAHNQD